MKVNKIIFWAQQEFVDGMAAYLRNWISKRLPRMESNFFPLLVM
jgi:hypothetical protein